VRYNTAVAHHPLGRLRDRLPINEPYDGMVADAYDSWIPIDETWPDEVVYRQALVDVPGPILELGCGTGRPLLRWLAEGLEVEGLDASGDMLAILRSHAAERGLEPVLHHTDFAPLTLDRTFGAIVCLAGSFMLIDDADLAERSLTSYFDHLGPGGLVGLSLGVSRYEPENSLAWRLRRTGTGDDGITYVVHEAVHTDPGSHLETVYNRLETYDEQGRLKDTTMRRHRLRWWEREEFEAMLTRVGFEDVHSLGDEQAWVTFGHRP
jgi:SAM-dependent methyltransferase